MSGSLVPEGRSCRSRRRCGVTDNEEKQQYTENRVTLSRELGDFVIRLSHALQRHSMYPPGHPSLPPADRSVVSSLDGLLGSHPQISIGVASDRLVVEGIQTDPNQTLLRELAARLHRHHLAALTVRRGVGAAEVAELLDLLCLDPARSRPLGLLPPEQSPRLKHIQLYPVRYDSLHLVDGEATPAGPSEQLWMALASAALSGAEMDTASIAPDQVAGAIRSNAGSDGYDRRITGHILGIVQRSIGDEAEDELRPRISELVSSLDKPTLRRLIEASGGAHDRLQLMQGLADWTAAEAVVDLAEAGAEAVGRDISNWMLRLLGKMSSLAAGSNGTQRVAADRSMRAVVRRMIEEWTLENPNPTDYDAALQRIAEEPPVVTMRGGETVEIDPARILKMSLEVRDITTSTVRSIHALTLQGKPGQAIDILSESPFADPKLDGLWNKLATVETVNGFLTSEPPDFEHLDRILPRVGIAAAEPMLEALNGTATGDSHREIFDRLSLFGSALAPLAVRRLDDDRWFVKRNMLSILRQLDFWPEGILDSEPFLTHPRVEVRREALPLLLTVPSEHDRAIRAGLVDPSEEIQTLALEALAESCPVSLVRSIVAIIDSQDLDPSLRKLAIRAISRSGAPEACAALLGIVRVRRRWNLQRTLTRRSPELLIALEGLARRWQGTGPVEAVLELARVSNDPEIRAAVARGEVVS